MKLTAKQQEAHENNLDAAYRSIDMRAAQGEDMSAAYVHPTTYQVIKKVTETIERV
jgi:hypothetical protein